MDVSNYTGPLTLPALLAWRAVGVERVLVQAVAPPPPYPPGVTRRQIAAAQEAGLQVEAYLYLWTAEPVSAVNRRLDLLSGLPITRVWLDVEDTTASTPTLRRIAANAALAAITSRGYTTGVYSGRWYWTGYMADTHAFASLPLWDSNYDQIPDRTVGFRPYGGWAAPLIKQYSGTTTLAGVGGVDLDAY